MRSALALAIWIGACASNASTPDAIPSCWINACPGAPSSETCGTCVHQGDDTECPPGFVCSCSAVCVKGPRSYDAGVCAADAGPEPSGPDARMYEWPACDTSHLPGT
jgi:hypothetical protein